jgi:hypothetical protein
MFVRQFPIIHSRVIKVNQPRSVPWSLIKGHEAQAWTNHGQSLETLAGRGGLDIVELWCVVHNKSWRERAPIEDVLFWLKPIENVVW